ncbi:MAG: DUF4381 family protein [Geothrix sp.]|nr:DUF4381 family protein [Geothrix sp.]
MTPPPDALADIIPPQPPPLPPFVGWQSIPAELAAVLVLAFFLALAWALWRTRAARAALRRLRALRPNPPEHAVPDIACQAAALLRAVRLRQDDLPAALRAELDALRYQRRPDPARLAPLLMALRAQVRRAAWRSLRR